MKNLIPILLCLIVVYSCSSDDDNPTVDNPTVDNVDTTNVENLVYNEAVDGDLSNDNSAPTVITFAPGDNRIISDQIAGNADYFTVTVPDGYQLAQINVDNYEASDPAFIGIASGTTISGSGASDLLGGLVYGDMNVGSDILPAMGMLSGATGFTPPLPSGEYTIWLNQTGAISAVILNFVLIMSTGPENVVYNEENDGDLSNDNNAPTVIAFAAGDNRVISDQMAGNADYFTVVVPNGYQLAEINVENYVAADPAFIGIAGGTSINGGNASDLLGGLIYGDMNVGTDILPAMGTLNGATGFTPPLPSGEYTIWLNQTGAISTATLNFVLNMP